MLITLVTGVTAANGAPTLATQGQHLRRGDPNNTGFGELDLVNDQIRAVVTSSAGSGTMTVDVTLWGYIPTLGSGKWVTATKLNGGTSIPEQAADIIAYSERVLGLSQFTRVYAEVTAIAGTATAVGIYLVSRG